MVDQQPHYFNSSLADARAIRASAVGRIRRTGKAHRSGKGRGGGARVGRELTHREINGGYLRALLWKEGKQHSILVHRAVAATFIGPRPAGTEVNHIDGNKKNNWPDNLEYVSHSENNLHAYRIGLRKPVARLGPEEKSKAASLKAEGLGTRRIAEKLGCARDTVRKALREVLFHE